MCGIVGFYNIPEASYYGSKGLLTLQHRGQEAAGLCSTDRGTIYDPVRGHGWSDHVFRGIDLITRLPGKIAVGHVRYSTAGNPGSTSSIQPFVARTQNFQMALVHNGNLTNAAELRTMLESAGIIFNSRSDSELFQHLIAVSRAETFEDRLREAISRVNGSYSLLVMTPDKLYAMVDPHGYRPLCMAKWKGGYVFASETCAFDVLGIPSEGFSEVEPGEMVVVSGADETCLERKRFAVTADLPTRHCSFEPVYYARPDSVIWQTSVYLARKEMGRRLARSAPVEADVVVAVPDSANVHALGYAEVSGLPIEGGLIRSHYIGRTFIDPHQKNRDLGVRMKLNAVRAVVDGRRIVLVDDSLVRGTTMRKLVAILRSAGAREVHIRIASPPVVGICRWGIDIPEPTQLAASSASIDETCAAVGADSLAYLELKDLREALGDNGNCRFCYSCFMHAR